MSVLRHAVAALLLTGSYNLGTGSAFAERTRNQGESERIAY